MKKEGFWLGLTAFIVFPALFWIYTIAMLPSN